MTDFKNGQELLEVCKKKRCSISEVMKQREIEGTSSTKKEVEDKMRKALAIMKEAVRKPLEDPKPSMSGLIGGEAKQITGYRESGTNVCGTFMNKLIAYSMAVLEVNASMGVIVAAPTAGSSGVVPGVLLALQEEKGFSDEQMTDALFHTAAIGYLLMPECLCGRCGGRLSGRGRCCIGDGCCCCDRTDGWNTGDVSAGSSYGDLKSAWSGL